jgi:rubrerythrin
MAREFGANEVLEVAERMERNAVKFYRKAAGFCDDPTMSRLFIDLARWERQHVRVFADMRDQLPGQNWDAGRYVLDLDDRFPTESPLPLVFGDSEYPSGKLVDDATKAEVLRTAIQKEKDTISYYTGLKQFIPGHHNIEVVKAVIREEKRHVKILLQSLERIPGK